LPGPVMKYCTTSIAINAAKPIPLRIGNTTLTWPLGGASASGTVDGGGGAPGMAATVVVGAAVVDGGTVVVVGPAGTVARGRVTGGTLRLVGVVDVGVVTTVGGVVTVVRTTVVVPNSC
jgi:hypothetical protein